MRYRWDITKSLNGGPITKPNRLCSSIIENMRLLSDDADDLRLWLHGDAITERNRVIQELDNKIAAEAVREEIQKEEMVCAEETALKVKVVADQKKKRLEDLRLQSAATSDIAFDGTTLMDSDVTTLMDSDVTTLMDSDVTTLMDSDSTSLTSSFSEVHTIEAVQSATSSTSTLLNNGESSSPKKRKPTDVVSRDVKGKGLGGVKRPKQGADSTITVNTTVQSVEMEVGE
ncbi:hypothetical protein BDP27DRAFT_1437622 [Rhodocollybia butyracea]|uniref:Uncharacterized protein n=1 Tax=Rhodocollybia butyracea TaxID=206335 RepID=A0A9P5TWR2_9AGAR|nr:hypothetical protein BDP27DRAFT_1437622 [Rhodocollybia butyracea]